MKLTTLIAFWLVLIVFGAAIAVENKSNHSEKYQVDTFKFGDMIDITVLPAGNYKWNEKYPSKLSFSLCNDTDCVIITEEIKIKK